MFRFDKSILAHFDFIQPLLVLPIIILSHALISEANEILASKQYVYFAVGLAAFFTFFVFPLRRLFWLVPIFYWVNVLLLLCVDVFGVTKLGAKRWLEIPFVNFTIQPSEFMKPALVLMLAYLIKKTPPSESGYTLKQFVILSFYILLPFGLIIAEPDLGTGLILLLTGYAVLFVIGVDKKIWLGIILVVGVASPILYENLHDYQKRRISEFLGKPSYQVNQAIIAIGNGGIYGKPKDEATQTHFKFLPIATSDFMFAYNIERYGFIGATGLITLYLLLILHLFALNYGHKEDYLVRVVTTGLGAMIFIYTGVNISMVIGFAPVVGVPLPFFSYGGSSFITFMCFFGILQNLLAFRFKDAYKSIHVRI